MKRILFIMRTSPHNGVQLQEKLDVVFYDVTTLYFESTHEEENSLRQKGYSVQEMLIEKQ